MDTKNKKCTGDLFTCKETPVYVAVIKDGPGKIYDGSLWCEKHMGETFREGNPYLKKMEELQQ